MMKVICILSSILWQHQRVTNVSRYGTCCSGCWRGVSLWCLAGAGCDPRVLWLMNCECGCRLYCSFICDLSVMVSCGPVRNWAPFRQRSLMDRLTLNNRNDHRTNENGITLWWMVYTDSTRVVDCICVCWVVAGVVFPVLFSRSYMFLYHDRYRR